MVVDFLDAHGEGFFAVSAACTVPGYPGFSYWYHVPASSIPCVIIRTAPSRAAS